jgi:hypothetical protein
MKKNLLIFSMIVPFMAFSQNSDVKKFGNSTVGGAEKISINHKVTSDFHTFDSVVNAPSAPAARASAKRGVTPYSFIKVGSTYYDLQSNASMGRRIMVLPDGRVSVVWTTSEDEAYTKRGTGYNHYDLTSWLTVANPTPRIENTRIGWPSIGINGTKEWVAGHDAENGGFVKSTNSAIGSTTWTQGPGILREAGRRPIWGRMANSGNYFHCVANYSDSSAPGDKRAPRIKGIFAPMTYSRSTDGGATWDIQHILLPGYDSTRYTSGGGDQYAIDVKDSIVCIVSGDMLEDVTLWKSTNNGQTFTKTIVDSFRYAPYTSKTLMPDTPSVCDGTVDVLIDMNGKAHVFWGTSAVLDTDTTDETYSFFPGTALMAYWNETHRTKQFIAGGNQFDRNKNGTIDISRGNTSSLENGQVPQALKNLGISSVARLNNTALLHQPSAGMDAQGRIFVSFSFPLEEDVDANNVNMRDIMMVHSTDTGNTWENAQDVTQIQGFEEEFASTAKFVNDFVHIVFQKDGAAGNNLQNNSTIDNNHPAGINDIMYAAIPVSKILDSTIRTTGIERFDANQEVFVVSQNFPNPFSNSSEVIIWLNTNSDVTVEISNINGQVINTQTYGELGAGNHSLTMSGDGLSSGIYFYTVRTSTHAVTRKMSIHN